MKNSLQWMQQGFREKGKRKWDQSEEGKEGNTFLQSFKSNQFKKVILKKTKFGCTQFVETLYIYCLREKVKQQVERKEENSFKKERKKERKEERER